MRRRFAYWLRCLGDRVDPSSGPRAMNRSFTIETGRGMVVHDTEHAGCRLWYIAEDYHRAFVPGGVA